MARWIKVKDAKGRITWAIKMAVLLLMVAGPVSAHDLDYELDYDEITGILADGWGDPDGRAELKQALADIEQYGGSFDPNVGMVSGHPDYQKNADAYYELHDLLHKAVENDRAEFHKELDELKERIKEGQ